MRPYTREAVEEDVVAAMRTGDWDRVAILERQLDIVDTSPPRPTLVGAALWYADVGLPVFPVMPYDKRPYPGTRGLHEATTDPEQIRAWWRSAPDSNVGVATGHSIDVIDFDGPDGHPAWTKQFGDEWKDSRIRVLATVSTPRPGGLHVYVPSTGEGNHAGMLPSVDFRGRGGYVLAPPSVTPQGTYRFLTKLNPEEL